MAVSTASFHSHVDPRTGAISRWVAGVASTHRVVFLASLDDVVLAQKGRPTTYRLYALPRYTPLSATPLSDYSVRFRTTRTALAKIRSGRKRTATLVTLQPVQIPLLLGNVEVQLAIGRLFHATDYDALSAVSNRGWGSIFPLAYLCGSGVIEPESTVGATELETTIYYLDNVDLKLHSTFRVE